MFCTIGELRKRLDTLEARWTPEDDQYMGKFEDQHVVLPVFELEEGTRKFIFRGYSPELVVFWDITGLGLVIEDDVGGKMRAALKDTAQSYPD